MFFFKKFPSFSFQKNGNGMHDAAPVASCHESQLSLEGPPDALVTIANRSYHYFAGNAYLGLQSHPSVLAATCEATLRYGTGTGTTRFALTAPPVLEVEHSIAKNLNAEKAFYHISGYLGPQILLDTLNDTFDRIFIDEASEKSILHAATNWNGKKMLQLFRHNDPDSLRLELQKHLRPSERPLVMTHGVFSASGKKAPLDRYSLVLSQFDGASLLIDDSHGFGILGKQGHGTYEHFGLNYPLINRTTQDQTSTTHLFDHYNMSFEETGFFYDNIEKMLDSSDNLHQQYLFPVDEIGEKQGTADKTNDLFDQSRLIGEHGIRFYHSAALSKAIGGTGGIIAGSQCFIDRLMERSTAFGNISSPPSPLAAGTVEALKLTFNHSELRQKLRQNTHYLKQQLGHLGIAVDSSDIPIVAVALGTAGNMRRIQQRLSEQGILIAYLPQATGLPKDGVLRITTFATHTKEMIDHLVARLGKIL